MALVSSLVPFLSGRKVDSMTNIQKAYRKQVKRIERLIRSYRKKGYTITYEVPMLKRPNKRSIEKLKSVTSTDILENSTFTLETGDVVSGYEARYIMRQRAGRKGSKTKRLKEAETSSQIWTRVDIIESIKNRLMDIASRNWAITSSGAVPHDFDSDVFPLISLMNDAEGQMGTDEYAIYLTASEFQIISELDKIREEKYLDQIQASFAALANLLQPAGNNMKTMSDMSDLADMYNLT